MSPRRAFWKWFVVGFVFAGFLVVAQARAVDGVGGMLQVGEVSGLRPMIETQLGEIPLADGPGHDGQIFYAIGLDLVGDEVPELLDHAAYRYRRILYPLLSSAFGILDGWPLLYGMIAVGVISMATSAGIVAGIAARAGKSDLLALSVVLNPGVWLSVQLLTSDVLALALMLGGLYAFISRRSAAPSWFSLSGLAKDVNLATPVPLGSHNRDWRTVLVPIGVLVAWMGVLHVRFGEGFAARGNLTLPLQGIFEATPNWATFDTKEWVYLVFAFLAVAAGLWAAGRSSWLRWPLVAWVGLALISSNWVWDFGNNAARAFAPIAVLAALSLVQVDANAVSVARLEEANL